MWEQLKVLLWHLLLRSQGLWWGGHDTLWASLCCLWMWRGKGAGKKGHKYVYWWGWSWALPGDMLGDSHSDVRGISWVLAPPCKQIWDHLWQQEGRVDFRIPVQWSGPGSKPHSQARWNLCLHVLNPYLITNSSARSICQCVFLIPFLFLFAFRGAWEDRSQLPVLLAVPAGKCESEQKHLSGLSLVGTRLGGRSFAFAGPLLQLLQGHWCQLEIGIYFFLLYMW